VLVRPLPQRDHDLPPRTRADEREVLVIDGGAHDGARDVAELVDDGSAGVTSLDA
jgi:hypothetical protein